MSILTTILISVISSVISGVIVWFTKEPIKDFLNQKIKLKNAPNNLLEHISPGTNANKVQEFLGVPLVDKKNQTLYKFKNVNLQIHYDEEKNVKTITLVLPNFGRKARFPIYPLDLDLGKLVLGDLEKNGNEFEVEVSSKHGLIWTECYFGNPGYYRYYTFGIFDGPSAIYPYDFPKFDTKEQKIYGDFKNLKINIVSISRNSINYPSYDFYSLR